MNKYGFRLERVARLLNAAEDLAAQEMQVSSLNLRRAMETEEHARSCYLDALSRKAAPSESLQPGKMLLSFCYLEFLNQARNEAISKVDEASQVCSKNASVYSAVRSRRKAIELLKQRRLKKHLRVLGQRYQRFVDETVSSRVMANDLMR